MRTHTHTKFYLQKIVQFLKFEIRNFSYFKQMYFIEKKLKIKMKSLD